MPFRRLLVNDKIVYKKNELKILTYFDRYGDSENLLLVRKSYIKSFFSLFSYILDGVSHGYKLKLYVKGKGLRLIARRRSGSSKKFIYIKLGRSHKVFFVLPSNIWVRVFERKRTMILYALNYSLLRSVAMLVRAWYPVGLYKIRVYISIKRFSKL